MNFGQEIILCSFKISTDAKSIYIKIEQSNNINLS